MRLRTLALFALGCPLAPYLSGQSVISTRSGLINFHEGVVFIDGQPLTKKFGSYDRLKTGSTLVTQSGRAEVLLTPNTYLRVGEDSSIRMVLDNLSDTQVELLAGSAILDSEAAPDGDFVKIIFKDSTIRAVKKGRYRVDAEPPQLRVYEGEAEVSRNGEPTKLEASQLMPLDGAPVVKRFTDGADGLLDIWSDERQSLIASNLFNSQGITDPLLDSGGTDAGADYLAALGPYAGYIPLATVPPVMGGYYGYGSVGYSPFGYPTYGYSGYSPFGYSLVYPYGAIRPTYSRVLSIYGTRPGSTTIIRPPVFGVRPTTVGTSGTISAPRPVFGPRPATTGAHVGAGGVRAVGHR
ncbi:MAG TPA: FecR family protein [Bryobacteraceae bacterium]|nr:FecR family protein [Bryobacteraceae bacterium]